MNTPIEVEEPKAWVAEATPKVHPGIKLKSCGNGNVQKWLEELKAQLSSRAFHHFFRISPNGDVLENKFREYLRLPKIPANATFYDFAAHFVRENAARAKSHGDSELEEELRNQTHMISIDELVRICEKTLSLNGRKLRDAFNAWRAAHGLSRTIGDYLLTHAAPCEF